MIAIVFISIIVSVIVSFSGRQSRIQDYQATLESGSRDPKRTYALLRAERQKKALYAMILALGILWLLSPKVSQNENYRPSESSIQDTTSPAEQKSSENSVFYGGKEYKSSSWKPGDAKH